jgi:polysaccharide biosynthesis protein PslG
MATEEGEFNVLRLRAGLLLTAVAVTLAAAASAGASVPPLHGFNNHAFVDPSSNVSTELQLEQQAGANVQRVNVPWLAIETARGVYNSAAVARLDQVVNSATSAGIRTELMVNGTPCWASSAVRIGATCLSADFWDYPPANPATYGAFVAWITARYGSQLAGVEVWNEPNAPGGSNFVSLFPARDYAALVEAAHAARTNGVPIVAGALTEQTDLAFMDQLFLQPGFRSSFDVWAVHAYDTDASHVAFAVRLRRDRLSSFGVSAPIWVDEFGWSSCSICNISEAQQGSLLATTFQALTQPALGVAGAMSYDLRDDGTDPTQTGFNFGVVTRSYTQKASYSAVRTCLLGGACQ